MTTGAGAAPELNTGLVDGSEDGTVPGADGGSGLLFDGTWSDTPDACTPVAACPASVLCGRYVDPCTGNSFACGSPCPSGQVCLGTSPQGQSCEPKTCAGKCGVIAVDSCGIPVGCGGCPTGQDCVGNQCVPHGSMTDAGALDGCAPLTCTPFAGMQLCGTIHDGCGKALGCTCPSGLQCVAGVCSKPAPECASAGGTKCGSVQNACGSGHVSCGGCSGDSKCVNGSCMPCTPPACGAAACGSVGNGCGPSVSCGTCPASEVCEDGGCCKPTTCAEALEGGLASGCGAVDLGCGIKKPCRPCGTGEVCVNSACQTCTPKTCADFGNASCGHSDGCGMQLNCCPSGTTCQGSICCAAGEVNYGGGCCLPACDLDLPPGTQYSCGQVLFCNGGGGSGSSSGGTSSGSAQ
jgi:hypothetical protein